MSELSVGIALSGGTAKSVTHVGVLKALSEAQIPITHVAGCSGGSIVGAPLSGRVLIVDDVITAGTAVREAVNIITSAGAEVAGLVISLDRQEVGRDSRSAVQELEQTLRIPVVSIVKLEDLIDLLEETAEYGEFLEPVVKYRQRYGVKS